MPKRPKSWPITIHPARDVRFASDGNQGPQSTIMLHGTIPAAEGGTHWPRTVYARLTVDEARQLRDQLTRYLQWAVPDA